MSFDKVIRFVYTCSRTMCFLKNQFTQNGFLSKIIDYPLLENLTPLYLSGTCYHTEKTDGLDV